ncbi:MAG: hypothetical protein KAI25_10585 [Hyphomicrobiaceae bacterium]|nr:hypothetical protein [Hyphomicrobiaceae bacterium]
MHRAISAAAFGLILGLILIMLVAAGTASAGGLTEAGELHAARLNANAGGPVSARDKELLERYGCLSGTTASAFCQAQSHRRYKRRRRRRR